MTKRLLFLISQLKRLAEVSNAENVTIELEREGSPIRVMPFKPARRLKEKPSREEEAEASLAEWQASRAKSS
ncbi:hypothetical protein CO674_10310 [Rhizobium hidalgonense]|uniref:Prevent-host-death protein n=1 Tax=Rhizobium hidalgonense TaxID=1538159 RepID=A0ABX4JUY0_9HYPH|nr:hypothetical protein CO674_10310 [Rhizobium hidalgonense]PON04047.1 hypothetical protein ATY29_30115 [Rhizobium hidalgonense]